MRFEVEVNDVEKEGLAKNFFRRLFAVVIKNAGLVFPRAKKISLSVAFISSEEMRRLNFLYRRRDKATDVLSFAEYINQKELQKFQKEEIFLGELILCYNYIYSQARKNNVDVERELALVVAHGILHLLGFSHGEKMYRLQEAAADGFMENKK